MKDTEQEKLWAWENALAVEGYNPSTYRKDACGAWIAWDKYGVQESPYGWEIDHVYPRSKGGTARKENLRALQHQNNVSKGDSYPFYKAVITSDGDHNVECDKTLIVNKEKQEELSRIYTIL